MSFLCNALLSKIFKVKGRIVYIDQSSTLKKSMSNELDSMIERVILDYLTQSAENVKLIRMKSLPFFLS
jgi:hypothetical protein